MTLRRRRILKAGAAAIGLAVLALVAFLFGWVGGPRMRTTLAPLDDNGPRLIHVAGWRGPVEGDRQFLLALRAGGCPHAMETFDWTDGHNGLPALWHAQGSTEPAEQLAGRIVELARRTPWRPIDLTADSSGGGVALAALAQLPPDVRVRTVVLSSPAVSRGYDLGPALAHVDGRLISFRSGGDWVILGLGTWLFGTVDGRHESGAGRVGFDATVAKLVQIDYDPAWADAYGHGGHHAQSLAPRFARGYVAPLLSR